VRPLNSSDWFYQYVGAAVQNGLLLFPDYSQITEPGAGSVSLQSQIDQLYEDIEKSLISFGGV